METVREIIAAAIACYIGPGVTARLTDAVIDAVHEAGYAIVPMKPNRAMIVAGNSCTFPVVVEIYRAMLTAAAGKASE